MEINKNNYEAYFLDYHEGNLTPQQVADVLLFVQNYPELKEELEGFENFSIEDYSTITFENKSDLKKEIIEANWEEYFIRAVENTLTPAEKKLLDEYIKQHPHEIVDYHLFQQTKLQTDASIVFENKDTMKKVFTPHQFSANAETRSEALISFVEGILSEKEEASLSKQIAGDVQLQKEVALYQQTILVADATIVFENKNDLKRSLSPALSKGEDEEDERKVVPLYYYMAAAAAILLLFGLFFVFNANKGEQFAKNNVPTTSKQVATNVIPESADKTNTIDPKNNTLNVPRVPSALVVKKSTNKHVNQNNSLPVATTNNNSENHKKEEHPTINEVQNNSIIPEIKNQEPIVNKEQTTTDSNPIAKVEKRKEENENEFLSLKEIAVKKLKENTLDENTLEAEKKSGRLKKLSGWDLARVVAKGISKVTGSKVKVEPKYNDKGDLTAYALGAGSFEITRAR